MENIKIEDLAVEGQLLSDTEIAEIEGSIRELSATEMAISGGGYYKRRGDDDDDDGGGKRRRKRRGDDDDDDGGGKYY